MRCKRWAEDRINRNERQSPGEGWLGCNKRVARMNVRSLERVGGSKTDRQAQRDKEVLPFAYAYA